VGKLFLFLFLLLYFFISCREQKIDFIPLKQFDTADTIRHNGKLFITKKSNYIVTNYSNTNKVNSTIRNFVLKQVKNGLPNITYSFVFYKSSNITNTKHLGPNPRDIDRYSQDHDMVLSYKWRNGKWESETVFKNGVVISPR
jgi:hypothetical protein